MYRPDVCDFDQLRLMFTSAKFATSTFVFGPLLAQTRTESTTLERCQTSSTLADVGRVRPEMGRASGK